MLLETGEDKAVIAVIDKDGQPENQVESEIRRCQENEDVFCLNMYIPC